MEPLVEIKNLSIRFPEGNSTFEAVKGISFSIGKGEIVGVVGESGSGKSMSALALMGLLPKDAEIASGSLCFQGEDLVTMKPEKRRQLCGSKMAMVFQEPMTSLNPVLKIERQVGESLRIHTKLGNAEIHERVVQALSEVGLPDPEGLCGKYPHELSGGMRQRVMIAQAMINSPSLLIADEPTTALDCVVQAQILELMCELREKMGTAIMLITHDMGVVAETADDVLVLYAGKAVEYGSIEDIFERPKHPYTQGLLSAIPRITKERKPLSTIEGMVPNPVERIKGCRFWPRCPKACDRCRKEEPPVFSVGEDRQVRCWLYAQADNGSQEAVTNG